VLTPFFDTCQRPASIERSSGLQGRKFRFDGDIADSEVLPILNLKIQSCRFLPMGVPLADMVMSVDRMMTSGSSCAERKSGRVQIGQSPTRVESLYLRK
jgi:hypothetical protein